GGDHGDAVCGGQVGQAAREPLPRALAVAVDVDREAGTEDAVQPIEVGRAARARERPLGAAGEAVEAAGVLLDLIPRDQRLTLRVPERARGEEPAEVAVAGAALDQEPELPRTRDRHLRADERADARAARGLEEARRAVDAAGVGECQRVVAERGGALDQILRQRGAGEEAERAPAAQLDVVSHGASARRDRTPPRPTSRSAAVPGGRSPAASRRSSTLEGSVVAPLHFGRIDAFTTAESVAGRLDAGVLVGCERGKFVDRLDDVAPGRQSAQLLRQVVAVPLDDHGHGTTVSPTWSRDQRGGSRGSVIDARRRA